MTDRIEALERAYAEVTDRRTALYVQIVEARASGSKPKAKQAELHSLDKTALEYAQQIVNAYGDGGTDEPQF